MVHITTDVPDYYGVGVCFVGFAVRYYYTLVHQYYRCTRLLQWYVLCWIRSGSRLGRDDMTYSL